MRVIGHGHVLVASGSETGVWHCVDMAFVTVDYPEGGCTCDGFSGRKTCRHYRAVLDLFGWPDAGPLIFED